MSCLAVAQVPGVDAVVNYTSPAEVCLQPALDAANLGPLSGPPKRTATDHVLECGCDG